MLGLELIPAQLPCWMGTLVKVAPDSVASYIFSVPLLVLKGKNSGFPDELIIERIAQGQARRVGASSSRVRSSQLESWGPQQLQEGVYKTGCLKSMGDDGQKQLKMTMLKTP